MHYHNGCVADVRLGDCRESLRAMAAAGTKAQMCVTSPPYFGLRDYGHEGQIGLEQTPEEYIAAMAEVFRCVRDVLADDGTLWLNIGDSYAGGSKAGEKRPGSGRADGVVDDRGQRNRNGVGLVQGCKPKDLIGIPWMLAFALRADGWYLRQDIIWHKPNPMPESVRDRCTKAHEYVFMLSKAPRYLYDADAIKTPAKESTVARLSQDIENQKGSNRVPGKTNGPMKAVGGKQRGHSRRHDGFNGRWDAMTKDEQQALGANRRSVWSIATRPYKGAHFATFPPDLVEPCILAGSRPGDIVLDPFGGSGTTAGVALKHGRHAILCELNNDYAGLMGERIRSIVGTK